MTSEIAWRFLVDWDRDGTFDQSYDNISDRVMGAQWRLGMSQPYQQTADEGRLSLQLKNFDRRFSPENSGGTYYGKLLPHRSVRVQAVYNGSTVTLYTGYVSSIQPVAGANSEQIALLEGVTAKEYMEQQEIFLPLLEEVNSGTVIQKIIQTAQLPVALGGTAWVLGFPGASELGVTTRLGTAGLFFDVMPGRETYSYVGDNWGEGVNAYDAIKSVCAAEYGRFFFARDGRATFWGRDYLQKLDSTQASGTVDNTMVQANYVYGEDVYTVVRVNCNPRSISESDEEILWQLDKPFTLKPGAERTIRARFTDSGGAKISGRNISTPSGTDFVAGSGVVITNFSAKAQNAEILLKNNAAVNREVTTLIVRGQKISDFNDLVVEVSSAINGALYGKRVMDVDARLLDDAAKAQRMAEYLLSKHSTPRGEIRSATLMNRDTTRASLMVNRDIGDCVRVKEAQSGNDKYYAIIGEEWELREELKAIRCTWYLEPAQTSPVWKLGVTGFGELGSATYLGF